MKKKVKPKDKPHYVNNRDFTEAVHNFVKEKEQNSEAIPSKYIGDCLMRIVRGLASRPNFSGYSFRSEMESDALFDCAKAITNYKLSAKTASGTPNAFGYFNRIAWMAFIRRIKKQQKIQDLKERYALYADSSNFVSVAESDTVSRARGSAAVERARTLHDSLNQDEE